MRTWTEAERTLRRAVTEILSDATVRPPQLVVSAGDEHPSVVIASHHLCPGQPGRGVAELAALAAAFAPRRLLVGTVGPNSGCGSRGLLVIHDLTVVADGWVEVARAWAWRHVLGRVRWLPAEAKTWQTVDPIAADVARTIVSARAPRPDPRTLGPLLKRVVEAGHHVHLAPRAPMSR